MQEATSGIWWRSFAPWQQTTARGRPDDSGLEGKTRLLFFTILLVSGGGNASKGMTCLPKAVHQIITSNRQNTSTVAGCICQSLSMCWEQHLLQTSVWNLMPLYYFVHSRHKENIWWTLSTMRVSAWEPRTSPKRILSRQVFKHLWVLRFVLLHGDLLDFIA